MFLPLTDLLTCPRCGPEHGLILLAERIEDRRVLEGALGCPRCRQRYPVVGGCADLRGEVGSPEEGEAAAEAAAEAAGAAAAAGRPAAAEREEAIRLAALMGVAEGGGYALVLGPGAVHAPAIAALVEGLEVVAAAPQVTGWPEESGVSRLLVGEALPFHALSLRGVALTGGAAQLLEEAARVLSPVGRLVVDPVPAAAEARLEAAGLRVVAREGEALVAVRA
jgi:uncharacterized protein YbaR (Trm112 family)